MKVARPIREGVFATKLFGEYVKIGPAGSRWLEVCTTTEADERRSAFLVTLARFEEKSLRRHSRTIVRIENWLADNSVSMQDWWDITPTQLAAMMLNARTKGPTAAGSLLSHIVWLRDNLGAPVPVGHPMVRDLRTPPGGVAARAAIPLDHGNSGMSLRWRVPPTVCQELSCACSLWFSTRACATPTYVGLWT